ncbi:hypothetical protein HO173_011127 [Letharia columbiana]|uniref:Uncharacterized protein n=1 Tax=Letharia columbiana TaxID=112416 RepID=A0A8H6FL75_9LECA|nr:uncharacterized protein HO173_011127 [Letharia columbiana]KAF6230590.1 hypothetical protein HO173_011127 [Letharia columbiana]
MPVIPQSAPSVPEQPTPELPKPTLQLPEQPVIPQSAPSVPEQPTLPEQPTVPQLSELPQQPTPQVPEPTLQLPEQPVILQSAPSVPQQPTPQVPEQPVIPEQPTPELPEQPTLQLPKPTLQLPEQPPLQLSEQSMPVIPQSAPSVPEQTVISQDYWPSISQLEKLFLGQVLLMAEDDTTCGPNAIVVTGSRIKPVEDTSLDKAAKRCYRLRTSTASHQLSNSRNLSCKCIETYHWRTYLVLPPRHCQSIAPTYTRSTHPSRTADKRVI